MYLPLNFIPVVGTIVFIILQGKRRGPDAHARYFQLKGWSSSQQKAYVQEHRGAYTSLVVFLLPQVRFANESQFRHCCQSLGDGAVRQPYFRFHQFCWRGTVGRLIGGENADFNRSPGCGEEGAIMAYVT